MIRLAAIVLLTAALCGCYGGRAVYSPGPAIGGDAEHGAQLIERYRCGSCHMIPGIRAANGVVGPPLEFFARRTYIAGEVPNTPSNLIHWIVDPQSIEPKTAMPPVGLDPAQARDVAAYLYTLR